MTYTVYVLFSDRHKKHYTGFTTQLELRVKSHNEFGHGWTAKYRPWRIIYIKEFSEKTKSMAHEKWLKTGAGRDFIKNLTH